MKIAAVSDDLSTIAQHFGRAPYYVVVTVEGGVVVERQTRSKASHRDFVGGAEPGPGAKHQAMSQVIADCAALLAGGMGSGAFAALQAAGIAPVLTDEVEIDAAAVRYAGGDLPNLAERVHEHRGEHHHGGGHGG
jgi:predicted Fe-Mo cluster-binding NifX family protein